VSESTEAAIEEMRDMIARARENYHRDVQEILRDADALATSFGKAIGEVSPEQALTAWKREFAKRLSYQ